MTTQPDFEALLKKLDHGKPNRDTDWAAAAELRRQYERITELEAQLEHERVRLAGCGVAAMLNTETSKAERALPGDYGYSASYGDVRNAVDREIELRTRVEELEAQLAEVEKGANRYRWLTRAGGGIGFRIDEVQKAWDGCDGEQGFNAALDKAMKREQP
jgi:hypothetical protein